MFIFVLMTFRVVIKFVRNSSGLVKNAPSEIKMVKFMKQMK